MAARWQFILTDQAFNPIGELLNIKDRSISLGLNRLDTASFKMRLDNPLSDSLIETMGFIKGYRNGILRFYGPVVTAEEAGAGNEFSLAVNAMSAGWFLQHRYVGLSSTGVTYGTATDKAAIAKNLIDITNSSGDTHIDTSTPVGSEASITYQAGPSKKLYDCITELGTGSDAFDWRILPIDNFANGVVTGTKIGSFVAQPLLGALQPEAIFEFGSGRRNIKGYNRAINRETQANRIWHIPSAGIKLGETPPSRSDASSITEYGVIEDVLQTDITDSLMVNSLLDEHIAIRRWPRQVLSFEPHIDPQGRGTLPEFGADYDVGDFVRARIVHAGITRVDGLVRIWGVTFSIDDNGVERANTILSAEES